ncbi:zinc finger BED domain-containing protein RICESLEEPER 1-like [Rosa chinensis]|uniref:zinc finger BED domain-containing protein RICESLEEPER 1-like n=1 Tax=Rosa chinensis TaxID=74649 RepID=UPI000D094773|nr:zinc finger BED domain-containing protein RICESLEEPER 1-like [Rosa chinensis]
MMRRLRGYKTLMFGGEFLHLRCACHIINLIVRDGLKELEAGIAAIWNCAKYVRSSSQRLDKFREFVVLEQCRANANIPLDVITRWNSTYLMLEAALKYETVFERMVEEDSQFKAYFNETDKNGRSRVGLPSNEDWRNAQAFCLFLKKFYEAMVKLSAWKKITANILFVEMITLQTEIDKAMNAEDEVLKRVATSMKTKFNKYWGSFESVNKIIMIANVLDPRYKLQWAEVAMEKVDASYETINSIQGDLKKILLNMYDEYKGSEGSNQTEQSMAEDFGLEGDDLENLDEVSRKIARERMAEQSQCIRNEVDQYLSDRYVSLLAKKIEIHKWWKANEQTYPVLSKLANDIFAIPCSIVASENAFSLGSKVVDPFRASLTPKMVEALVCTSDWLKYDPPNFYKDPAKDDLEMHHTLEELESGKPLKMWIF